MHLHTIPTCPVLYPSLKEFDNFREFMERLDQNYKKNYGMVKVRPFPLGNTEQGLPLETLDLNQIIPPKGWNSRAKDYQKRLDSFIVNSPIEQNTFGKGGIYECLHIPRKSMSFPEFKTKSKELDKITNGLTTNEVEEMFWKNVTFSAPLYGADLLNSLMDASSKGWNLNNLNSLLTESLSNKVKGINTPYCYVGSWKAFFCWHTEDLDLSGVNFIHEGKSKFWYSICYEDKHILEKEVQKIFPEHFSSCKQFLRHKTTLINPYYLKKKYPHLRITKTQHKEHQIIAVFGGSYHSGFNFGFNIAEAINYASNDWLRQVIDVKSCECSKQSVKVSIYEIYKNLVKNPQVNKTRQFQAFQEFVFKKAEEEDSEEELEQAKEGVSLEFSKKIKKAKRAPKKIVFKNEEYQISNWAQCERCKIWRVVQTVPAEKAFFECKGAGKQCYKKQKMDKKIFTIRL